MLFSAPLFLFVFFPAVLLLYFAVGRRFRNPVLLTASVFFYAWGEPRFVFVALLSSLLDWLLGAAIDRAADTKVARLYLALGVVLNIALLVYFKYIGFGVETLNRLLQAAHVTALPIPQIALPIGVSFIVFEKITYLADIYRKIGKPSSSFWEYLLYVFFFPKLLAGPIIKYHDIAGQLQERQTSFDDLLIGVQRFIIGLAKKVWIADTMGEAVDIIFKIPPDDLSARVAWLGVLCFTVQIFFDFSGYSDMAIGLARILGFRLLENFDAPYTATSFTDFWRRWHISLSTWIREYLYIPLGGNRVSPFQTYVNLWICFFLSGLWHGARWNFVLWGMYHGFFLVWDRLFWLRAQKRLPAWASRGITFFFVMIGWAIFRAESLSQVGTYLVTLLNFPALLHGVQSVRQFRYFTNDLYFFLALGLLLSFAPALLPRRNASDSAALPPADRVSVVRLLAALALLILSLGKIADATFNPFLYFRF